MGGVAQTHIHRRFVWQACHSWYWMARLLGDIHLRFTWQVWHTLTSTFVLRGKRGTYGTGWRAWSGFVACDAAALCVAGVALGDIHLRYTWQVWHTLTSMFRLQTCLPIAASPACFGLKCMFRLLRLQLVLVSNACFVCRHVYL